MAEKHTVQQEMWLRDVAAIKVLADQTRLNILKRMAEPNTVKAISQALALPQTKLYYHVNLLLKHGLIAVVDVNLESGVVEKVYQVTAREYKIVNPLIAEDKLPSDVSNTLFGAMLDATKRDFQVAFNAEHDSFTPPRHPFLSKKAVRLTDQQLTLLHGKLDGFIKEITALETWNKDSSDPLYELTLVFYKQQTS